MPESNKTKINPQEVVKAPVVVRKDVLKNITRIISEFTSGVLNDSHSNPDTGSDLLSWVLEDSDLRSGIEKKHSKINEVGWFLKGSEKDIKLAITKLESINFEEWLADSWWHELIFKNSFTEYGTLSNKKITSLNLIKPDEVEIVNTPKGKILKYLQIPTNPDGKVHAIVTLPKDKVFHCSFDRLNTSLWGLSSLKTLIPILHRKRLLEDFIAWLFESNQFRSVIKIPAGVNGDDVEEYLEMLKAGMLNPTNFLVLQGDEAEVTSLRAFEGFAELLKLLGYYQSKINKALHLPPLETGDVESSNRSSSEYQVRYSYYSHIKYLLQRKAQQINSEMFKRLGITKVKFMVKIIDSVGKKETLDHAIQLLSLNANTKKLNLWLINQGLDIPDDLLEEPEPEEESSIVLNGGDKKSNKLKLDKNSDMHPSRKAKSQKFEGGDSVK